MSRTFQVAIYLFSTLLLVSCSQLAGDSGKVGDAFITCMQKKEYTPLDTLLAENFYQQNNLTKESLIALLDSVTAKHGPIKSFMMRSVIKRAGDVSTTQILYLLTHEKGSSNFFVQVNKASGEKAKVVTIDPDKKPEDMK